MQIIGTVKKLRKALAAERAAGRTVGFVPTMGCLHEGHFSLVRECRRECGLTVVSIFVNPAQFGPGEDFEKYPRVLEQDSQGCEREGVDLLFTPSKEEIYPDGAQTFVTVEDLSRQYCGAARQGHFRGVATVVASLFNIVRPDAAYFGEKDFQQTRVIERMVKDLHFDIKINVLPTVREKDGLAMSSRNAYLTPEQRKVASVLHLSIRKALERVERGERDSESILKEVRETITSEPSIRLEYAEIADDETLEPASRITGQEHLLLAAYVGRTRLIDNVSFRSAMG
jgi:pantoate--beta-alanine ligase